MFYIAKTTFHGKKPVGIGFLCGGYKGRLLFGHHSNALVYRNKKHAERLLASVASQENAEKTTAKETFGFQLVNAKGITDAIYGKTKFQLLY